MEEFHEVAIAYYNNAPRNLQRLAWNFFLALDTDGDGRISYMEFISFLRQCGYAWISSNFFKDLDRDSDGCLGFWEVITLYYVIKTRGVWCQGCQQCLVGLYFTCISCFDSGSRTYDLCPTCYKQKKFSHHHRNFLDNHLLLRSKRGLPPGAENLNQALAPRSTFNAPADVDDDLMEAFQALETGVTAGNASTCIVM
ncbi:Calcium-binding EF-hand [Fagus crenata]